MAKQTSKAGMVDGLTKSIMPAVDGYLNETPSTGKREKEIKQALEVVAEEFSKYKQLGRLADEAIDKELPSHAAYKKVRRREIAEALVDAANSLKLPVQIKSAGKTAKKKNVSKKAKPVKAAKTAKATKKAKPTKKTSGNRSRITRELMAQRCEAVLKVLPPKESGDVIAKGDIAGLTDLDAEAVHNVLTNLAKQGKAENNKKRGVNAGWRRV